MAEDSHKFGALEMALGVSLGLIVATFTMDFHSYLWDRALKKPASEAHLKVLTDKYGVDNVHIQELYKYLGKEQELQKMLQKGYGDSQ